MKEDSDEGLSEIKFLVAALEEESSAISPHDFLEAGGDGRKLPGLYSWWVNEEGALDLTNGLGHRVAAGMIYAGLAGATRWPSGRRSSNTLWLRIAKMHLGANHQLSTFRFTIGAILASVEGSQQIDEVALTRWMKAHLKVIAVPFRDADSLEQVEEAVLVELDPPLNLKGMTSTPLRRKITDLRRMVAAT